MFDAWGNLNIVSGLQEQLHLSPVRMLLRKALDTDNALTRENMEPFRLTMGMPAIATDQKGVQRGRTGVASSKQNNSTFVVKPLQIS